MDDFLGDYILFDFFYSQSEGVYHCPDCEVGILEQVDSQTLCCYCCGYCCIDKPRNAS
jgi:hypothetical protein